MNVHHTIEPFYDQNSSILILGSFPSVRSRETGFFYGHPQNRFWRTLAAVYGEREPKTVDEKKELLRRRRVALWDVIASCEIEGSSDSTIRNAIPNDLAIILDRVQIQRIYTNGATADWLYRRYLQAKTGMEAIRLPSTSPANAAWGMERLILSWRTLLTTDDGGKDQ